MQRRLAAIMAADVVDYSRLLGENQARTLAALRALRNELFAPLVGEHGGHVVKNMGDGWIVEFPSISDAVACAVQVQQGLADHESLRLRIGIHIGEVVFEEEDVFGDGVNVAARLEGLAAPGEVLISDTAYHSLDGNTAEQFGGGDSHPLKNIARPVAVWRWPVSSKTADDDLAAGGQKVLALPDKPSIAVLPFDNLSGDADQEYFADGITEDILTELSRFSGLFVIARNSSFSYKGQSVDVKRVAQELGVRYMLEGSVRRGSKRLRITAQLLDCVGGGHVWGEKFDCDIEDVFELQDHITHNVVSSIAPQIELAELERSRKLSNSDLTAYELALRAQALSYDALRAADPEILNQAFSAADAALALDPRNLHALWTRSLVYLYRHMYHWGDDPDAALTSAGETAESLIHIDSSNAKAYMVRAWAHLYQRKFDAALADHHRALDLNPNLAANLFAMAWSEAVAGLAAEAKKHTQLALRLSPREADIWLGEGYSALALVSFIEGDYSETVKWGHLAYQMQPVLKGLMIAANAYLGDMGAAASHAEALKAFAPEFLDAVLSGKTEVCKLPEHNKLFVEGLRQAGL